MDLREGFIKFFRSWVVIVLAFGFIFQTSAFALTIPDPTPDTSEVGANDAKIQSFSDCLNQFMDLSESDVEFCAEQAGVASYLEGMDYYAFAACLNDSVRSVTIDDPRLIRTSEIYSCKNEVGEQNTEEIIELTLAPYSVSFNADVGLTRILPTAQNFEFNISGLQVSQIGNLRNILKLLLPWEQILDEDAYNSKT